MFSQLFSSVITSALSNIEMNFVGMASVKDFFEFNFPIRLGNCQYKLNSLAEAINWFE
jgi:hypothetical protein